MKTKAKIRYVETHRAGKRTIYTAVYKGVRLVSGADIAEVTRQAEAMKADNDALHVDRCMILGTPIGPSRKPPIAGQLIRMLETAGSFMRIPQGNPPKHGKGSL